MPIRILYPKSSTSPQIDIPFEGLTLITQQRLREYQDLRDQLAKLESRQRELREILIDAFDSKLPIENGSLTIEVDDQVRRTLSFENLANVVGEEAAKRIKGRVPAKVTVAGMPARVIRENVSWGRDLVGMTDAERRSIELDLLLA